LAQNNALSGVVQDDETGSTCPPPQSLRGWFIRADVNQPNFRLRGVCTPGGSFSSKFIPLHPNVDISNIESIDLDPSNPPPTTQNSIFILFRPANEDIIFYKNASLNQPVDPNDDLVQITLVHNQTNEYYQVVITKSGNIYEKAI
jgi:hypothetical protein